MTDHGVVSSQEWLAARKELLSKEKEFSRLRDELTQQRRELPWTKIEKQYTFDGPSGKETLSQLFGLGIYNFLDIVTNGRDEDGLPYGMAWVRHKDRYDDDSVVDPYAK